jgi:hypothetical protein
LRSDLRHDLGIKEIRMLQNPSGKILPEQLSQSKDVRPFLSDGRMIILKQSRLFGAHCTVEPSGKFFLKGFHTSL